MMIQHRRDYCTIVPPFSFFMVSFGVCRAVCAFRVMFWSRNGAFSGAAIAIHFSYLMLPHEGVRTPIHHVPCLEYAQVLEFPVRVAFFEVIWHGVLWRWAQLSTSFIVAQGGMVPPNCVVQQERFEDCHFIDPLSLLSAVYLDSRSTAPCCTLPPMLREPPADGYDIRHLHETLLCRTSRVSYALLKRKTENEKYQRKS